MARKSQTELEMIAQCRTAIENSVSSKEISDLLLEVGYGTEQMQEGQSLLSFAITSYESNKDENTETSLAHDAFKNAKKELELKYRKHRKRAKVLYSEDISILKRLDVHQSTPTTYFEWIASVKVFYKVILKDDSIQSSFRTLKVTTSELQEAQSIITKVEQHREAYLKEKGESQDATKIKDKAIGDLDKWIRKFYQYAEIALEEQPQLMESLGKFVRS